MPSTTFLSILNILAVPYFSMTPCFTASQIIVYFIRTNCRAVMPKRWHTSSYSWVSSEYALSSFAACIYLFDFRLALVLDSEIPWVVFDLLVSSMWDFCWSADWTSARVLYPLALSSLSSCNLCLIYFSLMIPWTSFSWSSAELNLENIFIIL